MYNEVLPEQEITSDDTFSLDISIEMGEKCAIRTELLSESEQSKKFAVFVGSNSVDAIEGAYKILIQDIRSPLIKIIRSTDLNAQEKNAAFNNGMFAQQGLCYAKHFFVEVTST